MSTPEEETLKAGIGHGSVAPGRLPVRVLTALALLPVLALGSGESFAAPIAASAGGRGEPIELDGVALEGRTEAERVRGDAGGPRLNGLVLLHLADGFGAGGQLSFGNFGLRASLGYQPLVFIFDTDPQDQTFGDLEFSNSAQLNVDALLLSTRSEVGASLGYRYNTLLGHGAAVAFQAMFRLWQQRFSFSVPLLYFPAATERVREEHGLSPEYRINFPFGAGIQCNLGVAWLL